MDFLSWAASAWGSLSGSAQAAVKMFGEIADPYMWRSLGWIGLGLILLLMGAALWLRAPQFAYRATIGSGDLGDLAKVAR